MPSRVRPARGPGASAREKPHEAGVCASSVAYPVWQEACSPFFGSQVQSLKAVVLAGGMGRRLQGLARRLTGRSVPKQFCAFADRVSLLQATIDRTALLVPPADTIVVVGTNQRPTAREQLRGRPGITILAQPNDRGTGAAVVLPLVHLLAGDPAVVVLVTPSDHGVRNALEFVRGVVEAWRAVDSGIAEVVLLGIEAAEPRSDYGWITPGEELGQGIRRVAAFREKPPPRGAHALHRAGAYWNTMVLVARGRALLELFRRARPDLVALFEPLGTLPEPQRSVRLRQAYGTVESCDLSREILAAAEGLAVCRWSRRLGWCDLGTPQRVLTWLGKAEPPLVTEA